MLYVPQEIGVDAARRACARLQGLAAGEKGQVLSVVAQLNSRPDALLEEGELSPGELRKLVLAEAVLTKPQLLVMDEPTNHLDLHSIEALERLLSDFPWRGGSGFARCAGGAVELRENLGTAAGEW